MAKWQIYFDIDKCKVMNVGRENPHNRCNINRVMLNRSECERDLGVQVHCPPENNVLRLEIGLIGC